MIARHNDVISIAPILVRLSRILHNIGTATAVLAVPVPPPLVTFIDNNLRELLPGYLTAVLSVYVILYCTYTIYVLVHN